MEADYIPGLDDGEWDTDEDCCGEEDFAWTLRNCKETFRWTLKNGLV
jgi:hypothetical protein